jgi:hypothetical protein
MKNGAGNFEFVPLNLSIETTSLQQKLEASIPQMERGRGWTDFNGQLGICSLLGSKQSIRIEKRIQTGYSKFVEIGGGHLETAAELAKMNSTNELMVIEPFIDERDLSEKPQNLKVIAKKVEDVTTSDIPDASIDIVYSGGHVLNYIPDKLGYIQKAWQMLRTGGCGMIEVMGDPFGPSIQQIIDRFHLNKVVHVETVGPNQVIVIEKTEESQLDFGNYTVSAMPSGNLPGEVNSYYDFQS